MCGSSEEVTDTDMREAVDSIIQLALGAHDPDAAWRDFAQLVADHVGEELASPLRGVRISSDIERVRAQLVGIFQSEPPPDDLDTLHFGLYTTMNLDDDGEVRVTYYVAGIWGDVLWDDPSLREHAWWPANGRLESSALAAIGLAETEAGRAIGRLRKERVFLGIVGELGAALIVTRFAVSGLEGRRKVVVGTCSEFFVELDG